MSSSSYMKSKTVNYMNAEDARQALLEMLEDASYRTDPGYSINTELYPDNAIPFIEEHMNYIKKHPQTDPAHYLSNLRLMLKIR